MHRLALAVAASAVVLTGASAFAQDPPLPRVVADVHGIVPTFPNDSAQLAASRFVADQNRSLLVTELPGAGLGGRAGVTVYLFRWKRITLGVGGEALVARSSSSPAVSMVTNADGSTTTLLAVNERLTSADGQVSFNFGTAHGWSYISGGVGRSHWSIVPAGGAQTAPDTESLPTTNYGGGAHWSIKRHLGFSLDVRVYEIQNGAPTAFGPGSPRTRLFVVGAGVFLK